MPRQGGSRDDAVLHPFVSGGSAPGLGVTSGINARLERQWGSVTSCLLAWPTASFDHDALAVAAAEVVRRSHPASFVARRAAAAAAAAGLPLPAFLDAHRSSLVAVVDADDRDEILDRMAFGPPPPDAVPFRIVVARRGLGVTHSHELGDGAASTGLLDAVVALYHDPTAPVALYGPLPPARAYLAGLVGTWRTRPRRAVAAVRSLARRRAPLPAAEPATGHAALLVTADIPEEELRAIREWRNRQQPRPSMTLTLLWIVSRVLGKYGYGDRQRWQVMVGMRRYSDTLRTGGGNPVGRALVEIAPETRPATLTDEVGAVADSGELLVLHLLKMARMVVLEGLARRSLPAFLARRMSPEARTSRAIAGSAALSWSDLSPQVFSAEFFDRVRDPDAEPPTIVAFRSPFQAGVDVNAAWPPGRAALTLSFGSVDPSDARRITDELSTRPSAWLPE